MDLAASLDRVVALLEQGRSADAEHAARIARMQFPAAAEAARLHGAALLRLERPAEARSAFDAAIALAPGAFEAHTNLASALLACDDAEGAERALARALALAPGHPAVLNGLGNARRARGDLAGAREAYAAVTRAAPHYAPAWLNLAGVELEAGEAETAEAHVRRAQTLAPSADAALLLGHALAARRRFEDAEEAYAAGAALAPQDARLAYQVGLMAEERGDFARAAAAYERTLRLDPAHGHALGQLAFVKRSRCDWDGLDALSARMRAHVAAGKSGVAPFAFLAEDSTPAEQLACARLHAQRIERAATAQRTRLAFAHPRRAPGAPLRVGFLANGFGEHATALLTAAFFERLRETDVAFQLFASSRDDGGPLRARLRAAAHALHDVAGLPAFEVARRVHASGVEVLLDLDGYCGGGTPEVFALRPAPLQVNWLAYPGTMGAAFMDYAIADRCVLPAALRPHFSEAIAYLPRCYQPSDPTRALREPPSRADLGLPETGAVYVCFNNGFKLNPRSFARMCAVLRAVPGAALWLLSGADGADERLREAARAHGVDPARLAFAAKRPHLDYLALYRHADLFLDTETYNAHTTASDAIWAGCPVLTRPGEAFAARVAASLNHHLGTDALNVAGDEAFVDAAVRLGRDAGARAALRAELAERKRDSGLFDMTAYARDFAALLRAMAERHRAGLPPADLG
ncbi:MAG: tetratricopeptide repeat protein [Mizugakiibacter sp.]|uniref:O-linked N-acetylglucosamine transferase, SPINDLY family protein n=1 Tax=Mizugakiibacter sp. TaxID=1972610 RepID=UPI0031C50CFC|nr:tetratricopeptide repeat protein [Xanthomonadaceae bacterium]